MRIGIIGAGKVGISIGYVLKNNGVDVVALSDRLGPSLDTARGFLGIDMLYTADNMEVVGSADVIAITTQDRAIDDVAREISAGSQDLTGKLFFHTSGADPCSILTPLGRKGAHLGSLHPLQTFPDIDSAIEALPETSIFIEGDERAREILRFWVRTLGQRSTSSRARTRSSIILPPSLSAISCLPSCTRERASWIRSMSAWNHSFPSSGRQ